MRKFIKGDLVTIKSKEELTKNEVFLFSTHEDFLKEKGRKFIVIKVFDGGLTIKPVVGLTSRGLSCWILTSEEFVTLKLIWNNTVTNSQYLLNF